MQEIQCRPACARASEEVNLLAYQELVIELNQINPPVELRIVSISK
jgi:hypothetical protein